MYGKNYQQHSFSNVKSKEYQSSTNRDNSNLSKSNKHSILQMEQTSDKVNASKNQNSFTSNISNKLSSYQVSPVNENENFGNNNPSLAIKLNDSYTKITLSSTNKAHDNKPSVKSSPTSIASSTEDGTTIGRFRIRNLVNSIDVQASPNHGNQTNLRNSHNSTRVIQNRTNQTIDETIGSYQSEQFNASTSESLQHCNEYILCYYNRLVTIIGWRPLISSVSNKYGFNFIVQLINFLYVAMILVLLITGYVLQYATCFRQDNLSAYDPLELTTETMVTKDGHVYYRFMDDYDDTLFKHETVTTENILHDESLPTKPDSFNFTTKITNYTETIALQTLNVFDQSLQGFAQSLINRYKNLTFHNGLSPDHHHDYLYQCRGGIGTYYIIPALIHFGAFIIMLRQMRSPETDRFHNLCVANYMLMVKVNGKEKANHRLVTVIRNWLLYGLLCQLVSISAHTLHLFVISNDDFCFTFFQPTGSLAILLMKSFSLALFVLIDFTCIAIFITYALHCELNLIFIQVNVTAIREKRLDFRDFTKNAEEAKLSIDYLNNTHSHGVSILLIHFVSRLFVVLIEFFIVHIELKSSLLSLLAVTFWLALVIMPLVQAARVTNTCNSIRHIGHELRARPFCYQSAPYSDLDSLLNYTSTLHITAKLMFISVRASCVAAILLVFAFVFLILSQVNVIKF
ncbi:hypothetical protein BLOT_004228 [Blomia tropicalis]|nr:hypothetical protein BLOT_004228 [Blomia tropicalis]